MKRIIAAIVLVGLVLVALSGTARATTYYNYDTAVGGPLQLSLLNASYSSGLWTIDLRGTNSSASETLVDVHWVQQFLWDNSNPMQAFLWDNTDQRWEWPDTTSPTKYWDTYGHNGQNLLLALVDVNTPNSWVEPGRQTATVLETDSVPAISLGDFSPLQSKDFTLYVEVPSQFAATMGGFFVAVPEPGTLGLAALAGLCGLGIWLRRRWNR